MKKRKKEIYIERLKMVIDFILIPYYIFTAIILVIAVVLSGD